MKKTFINSWSEIDIFSGWNKTLNPFLIPHNNIVFDLTVLNSTIDELKLGIFSDLL